MWTIFVALRTGKSSRGRGSMGSPIRPWRAVSGLVLTAIFFVGCSQPHSGSPELRSRARDLYARGCSLCHGQYGKGDGPTARALSTKPTDWTNPNWQNNVTDEAIATIIVKGGAGVGRSDAMPAHPELQGDPVVEELVQLIREFGRT